MSQRGTSHTHPGSGATSRNSRIVYIRSWVGPLSNLETGGFTLGNRYSEGTQHYRAIYKHGGVQYHVEPYQ